MRSMLVVLSFLLSLSAFADSQVFVESSRRMTYLQADCDFCAGGTMVTKTQINIAYFRCSRLPDSAFEYEVNTQRVGFSSSVKTVTISATNGMYMDCKGPSAKQTATITIDELSDNDTYYVTNPSLLFGK